MDGWMDGREGRGGGPQNKLRHVCRAIKYMSGKSRRRYRLVRGSRAGVGEERTVEEEADGSRRGRLETEMGEIHETGLHLVVVGGGPERFVQCLLFAVIRGGPNIVFEREGDTRARRDRWKLLFKGASYLCFS